MSLEVGEKNWPSLKVLLVARLKEPNHHFQQLPRPLFWTIISMAFRPDYNWADPMVLVDQFPLKAAHTSNFGYIVTVHPQDERIFVTNQGLNYLQIFDKNGELLYVANNNPKMEEFDPLIFNLSEMELQQLIEETTEDERYSFPIFFAGFTMRGDFVYEDTMRLKLFVLQEESSKPLLNSTITEKEQKDLPKNRLESGPQPYLDIPGFSVKVAIEYHKIPSWKIGTITVGMDQKGENIIFFQNQENVIWVYSSETGILIKKISVFAHLPDAPSSPVVAECGYFCVPIWSEKSVWVFDENGHKIAALGTGIVQDAGEAIIWQNTLFLNDPNSHRMLIFDLLTFELINKISPGRPLISRSQQTLLVFVSSGKNLSIQKWGFDKTGAEVKIPVVDSKIDLFDSV